MIDLGTGHPAVHTTRRETVPAAPIPESTQEQSAPAREQPRAEPGIDGPAPTYGTVDPTRVAGIDPTRVAGIDPTRVAGIDLGTGGAPSMSAVTLSLDEANYLVDKLDLDQLPVVLDVLGRFDTVDERDDAHRAAAASLDSRGLARYGTPLPELAEWLRVVARPRWEIALRWHVDGVVSRLCLSRGDDYSVLTLRAGDSLVVQDPGADPLGALAGAIGSQPPMQFGAINAPTAQLSEAFDEAATPQSLTNRLGTLGAGPDDAAAVARAMVGCSTFAEIVGIVYGDGKYDPLDGPVTVFDTELGRIVGTSSTSAHGVAWSSLSPGTPARLRQALEGLVDRLV